MNIIHPLLPSSLLLLFVLHLITCATSENDESDNEILPFSLRGRQHHRRLKRPNHPCILVRVEVEYEKATEENNRHLHSSSGNEKKKGDNVLCELIDDDIEKAEGHYFVPIVGIEEETFEGIESGVSTFMAEGAVFLDGALQIASDASIEMGSIYNYTEESGENGKMRWRRLQSRHSRRLRPVGKKKILVVRADAYDQSTTPNMTQLSDDMFGTSGDGITLKAQYKKCSHGKLNFSPYDNDNGVVTVQLNEYVAGKDKFAVQDSMLNAATKVLGNLPDQADHIMLCLPKGTDERDWIAYAYVNHWLSVFNDDWCQQLSTQLHEIGHNLGLSHSGKGGDDYSDKSGMMGYSFKDDDGPLQCFNPAKSYMLGWYKKSVVEWNPLNNGTWFGIIVGVTDFDGTETVIVKVPRKENGKDLYIGYNRQKGFNQGVVDEGDNVVIVEQAEGYEVSNFLEGLHPGSSERKGSLSLFEVTSSASKRTIDNFENSGKNLIIDFMRYGDIESIDKAFVAIYFDDCTFPSCCTGSMCDKIPDIQVSTPLPTGNSTKAPTDIIDATPVLYEVLANSVEHQGQYFEIFNPHSKKINLKTYRICLKSGKNAKEKCMRLTNFKLEPGEHYTLCRNKLSIPNSKTCHQEEVFRIRKGRKLFISLKRAVSNRLEPVDKFEIPPPNNYLGEARVRKRLRMQDFCDDNCWKWSAPAQ